MRSSSTVSLSTCGFTTSDPGGGLAVRIFLGTSSNSEPVVFSSLSSGALCLLPHFVVSRPRPFPPVSITAHVLVRLAWLHPSCHLVASHGRIRGGEAHVRQPINLSTPIDHYRGGRGGAGTRDCCFRLRCLKKAFPVCTCPQRRSVLVYCSPRVLVCGGILHCVCSSLLKCYVSTRRTDISSRSTSIYARLWCFSLSSYMHIHGSHLRSRHSSILLGEKIGREVLQALSVHAPSVVPDDEEAVFFARSQNHFDLYRTASCVGASRLQKIMNGFVKVCKGGYSFAACLVIRPLTAHPVRHGAPSLLPKEKPPT